MQRLFSTFPNGWPGCGLLLLRMACSAPLLVVGTAKLWGGPSMQLLAPDIQLCDGRVDARGTLDALRRVLQAILQGMFAFAGQHSSGRI